MCSCGGEGGGGGGRGGGIGSWWWWGLWLLGPTRGDRVGDGGGVVSRVDTPPVIKCQSKHTISTRSLRTYHRVCCYSGAGGG